MRYITLLAVFLLLAGCTNVPANNNSQEKTAQNENQNKIVNNSGTDNDTESLTVDNDSEEVDSDSPENNNSANNISEDEGIDGWQVYEKPEKNIKISFHKDWWFKRDASLETKEGYFLFVGFAQTYDVLTKERPFPIELFAIDSSKYEKISQANDIIIKEIGDKTYFFRTSNRDKYIDIIDKMKDTFVYVNEVNPE